jgi:hypothetical protein
MTLTASTNERRGLSARGGRGGQQDAGSQQAAFVGSFFGAGTMNPLRPQLYHYIVLELLSSAFWVLFECDKKLGGESTHPSFLRTRDGLGCAQ